MFSVSACNQHAFFTKLHTVWPHSSIHSFFAALHFIHSIKPERWKYVFKNDLRWRSQWCYFHSAPSPVQSHSPRHTSALITPAEEKNSTFKSQKLNKFPAQQVPERILYLQEVQMLYARKKKKREIILYSCNCSFSCCIFFLWEWTIG